MKHKNPIESKYNDKKKKYRGLCKYIHEQYTGILMECLSCSRNSSREAVNERAAQSTVPAF